MSDEEYQAPPDLPSAEDLCVRRPLYAPYEIPNTTAHKNQLYRFISSNFQIDTFCPWCAQATVLLGGKFDLHCEDFNFRMDDRTFEKKFICSRRHNHEFYFYFRLEHRVLTKVGQSPSMADIEQGQIQHYRSVLEREHYQELNRALGLASHGVGIGSFVYLRRIFERLVDEARAVAAELPGWDQESFLKCRMDEKILLLKDHLPSFLVEQRTLYGILSQGVHCLDEETCLVHFPVIRAGIELILDQKLSLEQQARKMADAKKQIGQIQQQLKNG
jgi:hypothetical protein